MGAFTRLTDTTRRSKLLHWKARWELVRGLVFNAPVSAPHWGLWDLEGAGEHIPVLWSRSRSSETDDTPLVFSVGFGASVRDYEPLAAVLQERHPLFRVGHPGFGRWAALGALFRLARERFVSGASGVEAARRVRAMIHAEDCRTMRLLQLELAVAAVLSRQDQSQSGARRRLSLAGHSFGTDTVLQFALQYGHTLDIETLYLFSPHPPGYLIPSVDYARLKVGKVVLVSGTRDHTRDGVGPDQRLKVAEHLKVPVQAIVLDGVGHMDVAFPGLGPIAWPKELHAALFGQRSATDVMRVLPGAANS